MLNNIAVYGVLSFPGILAIAGGHSSLGVLSVIGGLAVIDSSNWNCSCCSRHPTTVLSAQQIFAGFW
jgi:hypothetical protein